MSRFYFSFLVVNIIVFSILFLYGDFKLLLNVELGALGSLITTLGSYHGYKKMVDIKAKDYFVSDSDDEDDSLKKIDDPYDLFSDEEIGDDDTLDIKEVIKEERAKLKTNWSDIFSTFKAAISFFRVIGYIVIIYCFFFLLSKDLLHPVGFLIGISLVPLTVLFRSKKMV